MYGQLEDQRVFIRSMASRGQRGGLAPAALQTVLLMDARSGDEILIDGRDGTGRRRNRMAGRHDRAGARPRLRRRARGPPSAIARTAPRLEPSRARHQRGGPRRRRRARVAARLASPPPACNRRARPPPSPADRVAWRRSWRRWSSRRLRSPRQACLAPVRPCRRSGGRWPRSATASSCKEVPC
jgi:hypothetical protein